MAAVPGVVGSGGFLSCFESDEKYCGGRSLFDQSTHGGWAYGMPRKRLVVPEATPVTVALSRVTVGAARACPTRPKVVRKAKSTPIRNMMGTSMAPRGEDDL